MIRRLCSREIRPPAFMGMTLTELLVVIAIIGILMRITLPVFHHAKGRAQMTVCMSNFRQILQSIDMYAADYGGVPICLFPYQYPNPITWHQQVYPYVHDRQIFVCPADPKNGRAVEYTHGVDLPCSYIYLYTAFWWKRNGKRYVEPTQRSVLLLDGIMHDPVAQESLLGRHDGSVELAPRLRYRLIRVTFPNDPPGLLRTLNAE